MNVALTRAKHFLFVIARCESIIVNPYWNDLVSHARSTRAVVKVQMIGRGNNASFSHAASWRIQETTINGSAQKPQATDPRMSEIPRNPRKARDPRSRGY